MKNLRVLLLVLLALLLPVRGAMAAAMLCPSAGDSGVTTLAAEAAHRGLHAADGLHADHATVNHHAFSGDGSVDAASASDGHSPGCQVCASGCCITPLAFAPPAVVVPRSTASTAFPALSAPVPAFQSGGQDRPPRPT